MNPDAESLLRRLHGSVTTLETHREFPYAGSSLWQEVQDYLDWRDKHLSEDCIMRIGEHNGRAFVVYLKDGKKITVGRSSADNGLAAWLEIKQQANIVAMDDNGMDPTRDQSPSVSGQGC